MDDKSSKESILWDASPASWTAKGFDNLKKQVRAARKRFEAKKRKKILLDLVNLRNDGCQQFKGARYLFGMLRLLDDKTILKYRDELKRLWRGERGEILAYWVNQLRLENRQTWTLHCWTDGSYSVEPNYDNFPLALAIAVGEWMLKMAICENPDCPNPYFLKGRNTQQFCDRPACIACGQRQHKLDWWRRVGTKRRANQKKAIRKQTRKERKRQ
jgi:hypothetical protein